MVHPHKSLRALAGCAACLVLAGCDGTSLHGDTPVEHGPGRDGGAGTDAGACPGTPTLPACTGQAWPNASVSCRDATMMPGPPSTPICSMTPLTDLGAGTYLGFEGGLYAGGASQMPAAHAAIGHARAAAIVPRGTSGAPSPTGRTVLLSIGMSNTAMEFCAAGGGANPTCKAGSFMKRAQDDPAIDHAALAIVNGAHSAQTANRWLGSTNYDRIRDTLLAPRGLSEQQVQAVWLKLVNTAVHRLPHPSADPYVLVEDLGDILRMIRQRYPNVQQVFVSSRIYAGYARCGLSLEPHAYESGLAVKWLIDAQIRQMADGTIDPRAGNLDHTTVAPWIAWGPYLWADGTTPRSDCLTWPASDYEPHADYTHPGDVAVAKVGQMLLEFFKTSPHTSCWFLAGGSC